MTAIGEEDKNGFLKTLFNNDDNLLRCKCDGGPPAGSWCQQNTAEDKDEETCDRLSPCILSMIFPDEVFDSIILSFSSFKSFHRGEMGC